MADFGHALFYGRSHKKAQKNDLQFYRVYDIMKQNREVLSVPNSRNQKEIFL